MSWRPRYTTIGLLVATVVAVGYLAVVPARNYLDQQQSTAAAEAELAALDQEQEALEQRAADLEDPELIERLARERYSLVLPGEEAFALLPDPPPPLPVPTGWPFDVLRGGAAAGP